MFELLMLRVAGAVDVSVQAYAASRIPQLMSNLIASAVERWARESFHRFDDGEINCTVRLYDLCDRLLSEHRTEWPCTRVQYDGALPSRDMRAGRENVKRAVRPDLFVFIGSISIHVEAKLLSSTGGLPRYYVDRGMKRFLSRSYAWSSDSRGIMVSYNLTDPPATGLAAVNRAISKDPTLGSSHAIRQVRTVHSRVELHESTHGLHFDLLHYAIDMR